MATHDYVLANASGAAFRADLNNALAAIVSNNSSTTEPATTYAYMWWADTTNGQLKRRNAANDGWIVVQELDGTFLMEDGTVGAPGLAFADDIDTGLFRPGANQLAIATNGVERIEFGTSEVVVNDGGADVDFRVEGDTEANLLVVDAGNDRIGIAESAPGTLVEIGGETPYVTLKNSTEEDADGGRESRLIFEGEQSGGEISSLAQIEVSHDGSADDEKGKLIISTNDGSDGAAPTTAVTVDSDQNVTLTGGLRLGDSDNSNWVALQAPATVSSNVTWTLPAADGTADQSIVTDGSGALSFVARSRLVRGTAVTASGTSVTFTSIPSWARKITFTFVGLSTNGTAHVLLRIGDSGGVETTSYVSSSNLLQGGTTSASVGSTFGFVLYSSAATNVLSGQITLTNYSGNAWVATGLWDYSNATGITGMVAGYKGLSDVLDRVQILAANGTDAFDSGTLNIVYEG